MNVDIFGGTEMGPRLAADIAAAQGYHMAQAETGGNVLMSRLPILHHFTYELPTRPDTEQRTALFAEVELEAGPEWFAVTHLVQDAWGNPNNDLRLEQSRALLSRASQLKAPVNILGDLNFTPGSEAFGLFDERYNDALVEQGLGDVVTFNGFLRDRHLDFLWVSDMSLYVVVGAGRIDSRDSTDHEAIAATLYRDRDQ